jgi:hypothetical protein
VRKLLVPAILVLALTLAISAVQAERAQILGAGASSCGNWLSERQAAFTTQNPSAALWGDSQWILGFIAGANIGIAPDMNLMDGTTGTALMFWVDDYCKDHPLENVATAASALLRELVRRKTGR